MGASSARFALRPALRLAARQIRSHRLRSALSAVGVLLGVASVTMIVAVGEGTRREIQARFAALGTDTVIVTRRELSGEEGSAGRRLHVKGLAFRDALDLPLACEFVRDALPEVEVETELAEGVRRGGLRVLGTTPAGLRMRGVTLVEGRWFSGQEAEAGDRVALVSESLWKKLGRRQSETPAPVLRLSHTLLEVVGVFRTAGPLPEETSVARAGAPEVLIPLRTASSFGAPADDVRGIFLTRILVKLRSDDEDLRAARAVEETLLQAHRGVRDFAVVSPVRLLREKERASRSLRLMLTLTGGISLLVGAIGILNVMLASVSERRREVGIHRALGARRRQVVLLFVSEAVLLAVLGGVAGLVAGTLLSVTAARLAGAPAVISVAGVTAGLVTSLAVGVVAGLYPAVRASWMEPMDAIRV
ncbi:MAG: ABC transporter permease [Acidithiobacillales bacterium]